MYLCVLYQGPKKSVVDMIVSRTDSEDNEADHNEKILNVVHVDQEKI